MAKEYDNTNSGVLFPNDRKTTSKHPDFKGSCTIKTPDGELIEMWVSGWEKEGRNGPLLSLSFTAKDEQQERPAKKSSGGFLKGARSRNQEEELPLPKKSKVVQEELDDEIPFR